MKKVRQTTYYDKIEGTRGNCKRAAVASILELDLTFVPLLLPDGFQAQNFVDFMEQQGWEWETCMYVPKDSTPEQAERFVLDVIRLNPEHSIDGYYIVDGQSPRHGHVGHTVIYNKDGLAHDPHYSNSGVKPETIWLFSKSQKDYGFNPFL